MKIIALTFSLFLFAASVFQAKAQSVENTSTHATYTTIQAAINAASSGDVLIVGAGTYTEQLTINKAGITLQGDGSYPLITYSGSPVIKPAADNITIKGLEIAGTIQNTGGWTEKSLIWDGTWSATVSGLTVDNCKLHDSDYGIRGSGLYGNVVVRNSEFYKLKRGGVLLSSDNFASAIGMTMDIHDNYFHDFWYDITYPNNCKDAAAVGINNGNAWVKGIVYRNYISGMKIGLRVYYAGPASGQIVFSRNTIDMTYQPTNSPVPYGTMGFAFWGVGANASNIIIKDNIIANCGWYAIYQDAGTGTTIQGSVSVGNNLFYNNYKYYWPSYQLDYQWYGNDTKAQGGWTGGESGFAFTNNITAQDPSFKYAATDTTQWALQKNSPGLSAATDGGNIGAWQHILKVWIDDDAAPGWYNQSHLHVIQDGINLVEEGGTVNVAAGTYNESLNITTPLTLTGDSTDRPTIQLPAVDAAGITIQANDVTLKNLYLKKDYQDGWSNSILNIPRGGSYPNYTIAYQDITLQNLVLDGGREGAYVTAKDFTVEDCEFKNQYSDALYLDAVSGTTNIVSNLFSGADRKKAILFENFSTDPPESGTINIKNNTLNGKRNFIVYDQWIGLDTKIDLNITNNKIDSVGGDAISFFIYGAPSDYATKFNSVAIRQNDFTGVVSGNFAISLSTLDASYNDMRVDNPLPKNGGITIDATANWWGDANGPGGAGKGAGAGVTTNVRFVPFLHKGTDISSEAGFQGDFSALDVSVTGTEADTTGSIQDAIDMLNSEGTLDVHTGTYNEDVDINKNVTVKLADGEVSFGGNLTIGTDGRLDAQGRNIIITGNWNNSGTFIPDTGTVVFDGTSGSQTINNPETFYNLTVNKSAGSLRLLRNITVNGTVSIANGGLDLNGDTLTLGSDGLLSETSGNLATGGIIRITRALDSPNSINVGGLGAMISSASNLGSTTIMRGSAAQTGGGNVSIRRYFDITPTEDSGLNATLVFHYDTSELNGLSEPTLRLFRSTDEGVTWTSMGGTIDTAAKTVTLTGINYFSRWTLGSSDSPLPVQATSFAAKADYDRVTLTWKTQSEVDNAGFNILREDPGTTSFRLISSYATDESLKGLGTNTSGRDYSFTDMKVKSGLTYQYKIQSVSINGAIKNLVTLSVSIDVPKSYALYQNYPNPFNPSTTICFDLKQTSTVVLAVYNALGQKVEEVIHETMDAGRYNRLINLSRFASGVYYYRIQVAGNDGEWFVSTKKLLLMK